LHGILTLHEQIRTGELLKRRSRTMHGGAGIQVEQFDGIPSHVQPISPVPKSA
jgi:hypothetical protein